MAMTPPVSAIRDAARQWVIQMQDPRFADWERFAEWLEASPEHNAAYEAALDADTTIAGLVAAVPARPLPANDADEVPIPLRGRRGWLAFAGAAAAAVLAMIGYQSMVHDAAPRSIQTAAGEHRTLSLADGTRVAMNGDTRLLLDDDRPRQITLVRGEALFEVRHDASDPFTVSAGPVRLLDAGTIFNVVREAATTRVAVAEGAVVFNPGREAYRLDPGKTLAAQDGVANISVGSVATDAVGSWRSGRLVYLDASLDRVAADLARNLGEPVALAPGAERRRFTGTLALEADPVRSMARVAPLLGMRATRRGAGWILTPVNGA